MKDQNPRHNLPIDHGKIRRHRLILSHDAYMEWHRPPRKSGPLPERPRPYRGRDS